MLLQPKSNFVPSPALRDHSPSFFSLCHRAGRNLLQLMMIKRTQGVKGGMCSYQGLSKFLTDTQTKEKKMIWFYKSDIWSLRYILSIYDDLIGCGYIALQGQHFITSRKTNASLPRAFRSIYNDKSKNSMKDMVISYF